MTVAPEAKSVVERINLGYERFTASQRRIARTLLSNYPALGLGTVAQLAGPANVSAASVVRFVQALGFAKYQDFQDALRREVAVREESALALAMQQPPQPTFDSEMQRLHNTAMVITRRIEHTFAGLRKTDVQKLIKWLASESREIVAVGGEFSHVAARLLIAELSLFRRRVVLCPESLLQQSALLLDAANGNQCWVVFDMRTYTPRLEQLARAAITSGAKLALITDRWLSPIANFADVVLTCHVEADGPSDTLVPTMALVEALCRAAVAELGAQGVRRLQGIDPLRRHLEAAAVALQSDDSTQE